MERHDENRIQVFACEHFSIQNDVLFNLERHRWSLPSRVCMSANLLAMRSIPSNSLGFKDSLFISQSMCGQIYVNHSRSKPSHTHTFAHTHTNCSRGHLTSAIPHFHRVYRRIKLYKIYIIHESYQMMTHTEFRWNQCVFRVYLRFTHASPTKWDVFLCIVGVIMIFYRHTSKLNHSNQ